MFTKTRLLIGLFLLIFMGAGLRVFNDYFVKQAAAVARVPKITRAIPQRAHSPVCGSVFGSLARCHAQVVTDNKGRPLGTTTPSSTSYGPNEFHTAYNLPCVPGGLPQAVCATPATFGPQTIAIVDAYNSPNIESDLNTYSSYYGLPPCRISNGCLTVVNQNGGSNLPYQTNSSWALETSLDIEVAHMTCETCKIILVEANSTSYKDLGTAVNTAVQMKATAISNSYGGSEWSGEAVYDSSYFNHPGIAITASGGDSGYGTEYPAASPNVVSVGGTTLQLNTDNTYATESTWNGTGSGCSRYLPATTSQKNLPNWNLTNCGSHRADNDVSADSDPNTGAAVYDSTPYFGSTGWYQVGGTSLASPLIAGVYTLAGGVASGINAATIPYFNLAGGNLNDVTLGNNGNCSTIMCRAVTGFDGPTGLGSPDGLSAFGLISLSIPTPTPTIAPSPTAIPTPTPTATPVPTPTPTPGPSPSPGPTPIDSPTPTITPLPTQTPTPVPTATPLPTPTPTGTSGQTLTFGYTTVGNYTDVYEGNYLDGSRFIMGPLGGTLKSISAYSASVQSAPNNQYQVAIYADAGGRPGTLLAKSSSGTLTPNSWNALPVSASLAANTYYWLMYNTNATASTMNNLRFALISSSIGSYSSGTVPFGTWPATFTSRLDRYEYSIFASYTTP